MTQNLDGSIYFTYSKDNPTSGNYESFLSKLTPNGAIDSSFGNNGELTLPYAANDSQLKKQTDGKLVVFGFNDSNAAISRVLPNGQLDTAFGINGTTEINNVGSDMNVRGYGLLIQNNKIILYGEALDPNSPSYLHYKVIYRLNEDGSIDTTFGNNGLITTADGKFIFLDNQSNVVVLGGATIEKYNNNGQPITSFGNNGIVNHSIPYGYVGSAYMDSNNNIVYSNIDAEIGRIKSNGTLDSTFNFDPTSLPFTTWILSIIEKNGNYYIGGMNEGSDVRYFISKLNQDGTMNSSFSYYSETNPDLGIIGDMIVNDNNIIANGSNNIVKYLLNTATLSTTETVKNNQEISFENPVKQNLIYKSKEKVSKIEIYSADGKIVKTLKDNNANVSELLKGIYFAKITFENGKTVVKKLMKN